MIASVSREAISRRTAFSFAVGVILAPVAHDRAAQIDGKLVTYLPPFKREIGMVSQNYALFPHMTIFEVLIRCSPTSSLIC